MIDQKLYEKMKHEIAGVASMHRKANKTVPTHGTRYTLPLNGREIEIILYKGGNENAPLVFATFGGGFMMGGCALDDGMWTDLSTRFGWNIVSIGYRLAPDNVFPAAADDVYDSMCYVRDNQEQFGLNTSIYYVYGASAGGNLATVTAMRDAQKDRSISRQFLFYPYIDLATDPASKGHPEDELYSYYLFRDSYAPEEAVRNNPYVSPVIADPNLLALMPETIIVTAENDTLRREDEKYRDKLVQAGVTVHYLMCNEVEHGFIEHNYSLPALPKEILENLPGHAAQLFASGKIGTAAGKALDFISSWA